MSLFSSNRERRLWTWTLVVILAIYSSLPLVGPLSSYLRENNLLRISVTFLMIIVSGIAIWMWIRGNPNPGELGVVVATVAVYFWTWIRIQIPEERTHLIEYSLVAILIHLALLERQTNNRVVPVPGILAILLTALLGLFDEGIQQLLPNRVFDLRDVSFNTLAGLIAVGARSLVIWKRKKSIEPT